MSHLVTVEKVGKCSPESSKDLLKNQEVHDKDSQVNKLQIPLDHFASRKVIDYEERHLEIVGDWEEIQMYCHPGIVNIGQEY